MNLLRFLLLLLASCVSDAQTRSSDMTLHAEMIGGTGYVPPNTLARVRLTITNKGPDPGGIIFVWLSYSIASGYRTLDIGPVAETAPCRVVDDSGFSNLVTLLIQGPLGATLDVGQSYSCIVGLVTHSTAPESFSQIFSTTARNDPDLSNNNATINIRTRELVATQLPALGLPMTLALAGLSLLLGVSWMRLR
jgi:hypothetical protein